MASSETARRNHEELSPGHTSKLSMSPLQYQKMLRLQTARERMLMDGLDATTAAYEVGYAPDIPRRSLPSRT